MKTMRMKSRVGAFVSAIVILFQTSPALVGSAPYVGPESRQGARRPRHARNCK